MVVAVVVAVAVGIATVRVTWRATNRRHKLSCIVRYTPLLAESNSYGNLIKVTYGDKAVKMPTIVLIWLYNTGRTDISSSSFDDSRPFVVDIGVNILANIPATDGESLPEDKFRIDGSHVMIGPYLIDAGAWIVTTLLVDGIPENVQMKNPLVNTDVTKEVANQVAPAGNSQVKRYALKALSQRRPR